MLVLLFSRRFIQINNGSESISSNQILTIAEGRLPLLSTSYTIPIGYFYKCVTEFLFKSKLGLNVIFSEVTTA